ncbi:MAG: biosynthetic-type acetolactate synthase large subunit [Akkermansia sp.]
MSKKDTQPTSPSETHMTGAEVLVKCLVREGVDVIFAYPGGASMPMHQALSHESGIRTILPRHEQGGSFAAEGYGRVTGKVGVCMSTSGPGATNMITAIADAYLDSTPMVAITAQVMSGLIGRGAFQETDVFGMTAPVVKHSYLVTDAKDLPRIVKEAFFIAKTGRPGPVVIDIPKDCQEALTIPDFEQEMDLPGYKPIPTCPTAAILKLLPLIRAAKRPVIYSGGGIISAEASEDLLEFAELTQIPVATTLMGIGAIPETHELSLRWLGMHGAVFANNAVNEADLVLALGARFDDRVTGRLSTFCEHATIIHIDIDASEINKNKCVAYPVRADIKQALQLLNAEIKKSGDVRKSTNLDRYPEWMATINDWKKNFPFVYEDRPDSIAPQLVVEELYKQTSHLDPIICTGVGQHQMFAAQFFKFEHPRRLATSGGLGSMGYGLPAAMGAQMAYPDKLVVNIDGDGSVLMNIQELATMHVERIPVKCIILNNQHLGMVIQWEDLKYDSNRAQTFLADPHDEYDPSHTNENILYPDFKTVCAGFGVPCERIIKKEDLAGAIKRMIESPKPYVLDVMVPYDVHVLPMIPGGMSYKDVILERIAGDGKGRSAADLDKPMPTAL